jgi:hypothetical protein
MSDDHKRHMIKLEKIYNKIFVDQELTEDGGNLLSELHI